MNNELMPISFDITQTNESASEKIKHALIIKKHLDNLYENLSKNIKISMEETGIYQYKDNNITISYVSPSDSLSLDVERLKEKYPKVYEDCLKIKKKSSSIRIVPKKEKEEK